MDAGQGFVSPLRLDAGALAGRLDFGPMPVGPEIAALRRRMHAVLVDVAGGLPPTLAAEAEGILAAYGGGEDGFFRLFYVPVWSFLHWVPAAGPTAVPPQLRDLAVRAHALALFLHLWDDHLCDGQLAPDPLRLHLRTLAWQAHTTACTALAAAAGAPADLVARHAADYLDAAHRPPVPADLDAHLARFRREVAIWTVVPRLLGRMVGGEGVGTALAGIVEGFSVAWRVVDDIQDARADSAQGRWTAVSLVLPARARALWPGAGRPDADEAWNQLRDRHLGEAVDRLRADAAAHVARARSAALVQGWPELARELAEAGRGLEADAPAGG